MNIRDCYKKRVEDDEMIFIGEAEITKDGTWEIMFYFPTRTYLPGYNSSLYYPEFYIEEDDYEVIKADNVAYESQLYISPPIDKDNLPYVIGLIDIYDWCDENNKWDGIKKDFYYYIDKFKNDRLVTLKLEIAENSRYENSFL